MKHFATLLSASLALSLASLAQAAIAPVYVSAVQDGTDFRWTYTASIASGVRIEPGDFFTIYDFGGLDGGNEQPASWAYSTADTGNTPPFLTPTDDSTIPNITFTYDGASAITGPADLGMFSVDALGDIPVTTEWASLTTRDGGTVDGELAFDTGSVTVPEEVNSPNIPEPAAALLALGLVVPAFRRRK
ncbi:MAG TPA: hypothetical protein VGG19_11300 [Tepidisphaeraceae bacterium]|jgi:hypothetical protein